MNGCRRPKKEDGQLARPSGGHQPNDRGVSKTSRALDVSRRELNRAQRIASISPEAKLKIRELELHDNQSALLRIAAAETADEQLKIAADIIEQKKRKPRSAASETAAPASIVSEQSLPTVNWAVPSGRVSADDIGIRIVLSRRDPTKA